MFDTLPLLSVFVIAVFLGIYLGRILSKAKFESERVSLSEN